MSAEKTEAIVIRSVDFSETSSIITFFTRDFGKVTVLAKGARRRKGPFESALDLLATCRIVFLHKSGDALDLLTEAKLQHRLRPPGSGLSRLYACFYIAELLFNLTDEFDAHPQLYEDTFSSLRWMEQADSRYEPILLKYEFNILRETGHAPSLEKCVVCGNEVERTPRIGFGLVAGGVVCRSCQPGQRRIVSIRSQVLQVLRDFSDPNCTQWRNHTDYFRLEKEIRPVVNQYITELLGKRPRLREFLPLLGKS